MGLFFKIQMQDKKIKVFKIIPWFFEICYADFKMLVGSSQRKSMFGTSKMKNDLYV